MDNNSGIIMGTSKNTAVDKEVKNVAEPKEVIEDKSMHTKVKVFNWLVDIGKPSRLKDLIRLKCPSHLIEKAVRTNKPITGTWTITAV